MAEGKYGRLFTLDDVREIVGLAQYGETGDDVIAEAERLGMLTFPANEPLFLLRGQDKAAPNALATETEAEQEYGGYGDYWSAAVVVGAEEEHLDAIRAAANRMREWQQANPDRVKIPD